MQSKDLFGKAQLQLDHRWQSDNLFVENRLPKALAPWLVDKGSLTAALRSVADDSFAVVLISQAVGVPVWHEQRKLKRALHQAALIREVELHIFGEAVVCARSIIPIQLANKGAGGLGSLGTTPLGHLLFKDGRMRVSKREFLKSQFGPETIYARRTPYDYLGSQILVSEYFLPSLNKYL